MARTAGSHSDITGPRIEAAALALIAKHGFAAVSMRQIAGEVGVQAGALYNYIPDKQTLLLRLMRGHMQTLLSESDELQQTEPLARLKEFVEFHIHQNHRRVDEVFVAYMELRNLTPENFAVVETLRRAYEAKLEAILQAGAEKRSARPEENACSGRKPDDLQDVIARIAFINSLACIIGRAAFKRCFCCATIGHNCTGETGTCVPVAQFSIGHTAGRVCAKATAPRGRNALLG